jgi:hypothetical protein
VTETAIASLKTIYERVATLYEHQQWARDHAGIAPADDAVMTGVGQALESLATTAASVDELVQEAELWLFGRQHLLPADRVLRDLARKAFASVEAAALEAINSEIPAHKQAKVLAAVHSSRRGRVGGTVLEWLKVPAGKHSPTSITEVTDKISYLKELGVDTWSLSSISNARLRAYAQAIANRPPAESRRRVEETQALETICFLRVTLLELTDTLMYMTGRRVNDLVRHASNRVTAKQARSAVEYRQQAEAMRQIIHDDDRSAEARIADLKELLPKDEKSQPNSHAALVRQSLADDATRVTALLNSFSDLDLKGNADQRPMKQVVALRELIEQGARELPVGFDADIAGPVWHDLLNDADRTKAFAALKASTMLAVRQGLRGGRLWIDHSWEFRNREDLLIPPAEWKKERQRLISALSLTTDPQKFLARCMRTWTWDCARCRKPSPTASWKSTRRDGALPQAGGAAGGCGDPAQPGRDVLDHRPRPVRRHDRGDGRLHRLQRDPAGAPRQEHPGTRRLLCGAAGPRHRERRQGRCCDDSRHRSGAHFGGHAIAGGAGPPAQGQRTRGRVPAQEPDRRVVGFAVTRPPRT